MCLNKTNIYHLGHSSFAVETLNHFLIFDYYYDSFISKKNSFNRDIFTKEDIKTSKKIVVFVSHSHGDHYNSFIFQWKSINSNINYVLSHDVKEYIDDETNHYMNPYEELLLGDLEIHTYGTTDKGVSFLVKADNITLFHAGDLNWWHWKDFTPKQLITEEIDFKKEIDLIPHTSIDIAFIPVDPRLEEYYYLAGVHFAQKLKPNLLVPMHFRDHYYICREFATKLQDPDIQVAELDHLGDIITYFPS